MNVVVIGAGLYGAAVTASLIRRGAGVTIVDGGMPGGGTSAATFSWINSCGKRPRYYHDLNVAGMDAHRGLAAASSDNDWYHRTGNIEWAGDEAGAVELRGRVGGLSECGYRVRWINRSEALALEPDLDPAVLPEEEIAYFPDEAWIEPGRLVRRLLSGAVAGGAEVVAHDAVISLECSRGAVRAVRLGSGRRVAADAVVNCAGPRAGWVARLAGLELPMCNTRGSLVQTTPVSVSVARVVHAPGINLRPDAGGRLLLHDPALDGVRGVSERVLAAARVLYPGLREAAVAGVRVGERPMPADGLPVLGRVLELPNFHFAVSHSGATLSVHVGELVAGEVVGEYRGAELDPFRFERFRRR